MCNVLQLSMIMLLNNKNRSGLGNLNRYVVVVKKYCTAINDLSVPAWIYLTKLNGYNPEQNIGD